MKDTTIFIICGTLIALTAILRGHVADVDNLVNVIIGSMAGCAVGFHLGKKSK